MIKSGQCSYTEEWCGGKAAFILEVTDIWQFCCCRSKISKKKKKCQGPRHAGQRKPLWNGPGESV